MHFDCNGVHDCQWGPADAEAHASILNTFRQGCARLIFSDWLDSDSYDTPGDSTPTQLKSQIG